jgi:hypothetical protein
LKKCTPQKRWRSASGSTPASALMPRPEVLLASTACSGTYGGDLLVQVLLPVHAFGDRFDHQVAVAQQFQPGVVVGGHDAIGQRLVRERGRAEFREVGDRLRRDAVRVAFLRGEVEQHRIHAGVGQVGRDLRPHDTGAEHRGAAHKQVLRHVS